MAKKKELLSKAPWRGDDDDSDKFSGAKLKVTKESDGMSKMHVPSRGANKVKGSLSDDEDSLEIDPQLRYSFNRNYQVSFAVTKVTQYIGCLLVKQSESL